MRRQVLRDGRHEIEVSEEVTPTGQRLRIRSVLGGRTVDLDPFELEGLTRLAFVPFPALEGRRDQPGETGPAATAPGEEHGLDVLRNEFAMVGVRVDDGPAGPRLRVRNMGSGAEVLLRAEQLATLTRLRHRDLAPLVDPSGLAAEPEPDPDQV